MSFRYRRLVGSHTGIKAGCCHLQMKTRRALVIMPYINLNIDNSVELLEWILKVIYARIIQFRKKEHATIFRITTMTGLDWSLVCVSFCVCVCIFCVKLSNSCLYLKCLIRIFAYMGIVNIKRTYMFCYRKYRIRSETMYGSTSICISNDISVLSFNKRYNPVGTYNTWHAILYSKSNSIWFCCISLFFYRYQSIFTWLYSLFFILSLSRVSSSKSIFIRHSVFSNFIGVFVTILCWCCNMLHQIMSSIYDMHEFTADICYGICRWFYEV